MTLWTSQSASDVQCDPCNQNKGLKVLIAPEISPSVFSETILFILFSFLFSPSFFRCFFLQEGERGCKEGHIHSTNDVYFYMSRPDKTFEASIGHNQNKKQGTN